MHLGDQEHQEDRAGEGSLETAVECEALLQRPLDEVRRDKEGGAGLVALLLEATRALVVGDNCIADHASDLAVALVALDAAVEVHGPGGQRTVPLDEFYRLPDATPHVETVLDPGEVIATVTVPRCRREQRLRRHRRRLAGEHCAGALAGRGPRLALVEQELVGGKCSL